MKILLVEDDDFFRSRLNRLLGAYGSVTGVSSKEAAVSALQNDHFDLATIDLMLTGEFAGLDVLKCAKSAGSRTIILTDYDHEGTVKMAYEAGCDHYLTKDLFEEIFSDIIKGILEESRSRWFSDFFKNRFVTNDSELMKSITGLNQLLYTSQSLFISGETGVGKGILAEGLHRFLGGSKDNFVALNCAAIAEGLVESELFGYKKGSFTGASQDKDGLILQAESGTLFLDEITSMPLSVQAKLLKVLEEKQFYPVGSTQPVSCNFRIISASCENSHEKVLNGSFREDLYYRISGCNLHIPALRDRRDDIPPLVRYFASCHSRKVYITDEVIQLLKGCPWYGNARELRATVEKLIFSSEGIIRKDSLPAPVLSGLQKLKETISPQKLPDSPAGNTFIPASHIRYCLEKGMASYLDKVERELLFSVQNSPGTSRGDVWKKLGITKSTYYRLLKKHRSPDSGQPVNEPED